MPVMVDYRLYLATDRALLGGRDLVGVVEQCLENGVTVVQLREKQCSSREFYDLGRKLHEVTRHYGVPLLINDRVDIMLALDAEGVHVGRNDLPLDKVRALAPGKIVGYTANTPETLQHAAACGADYVGIGPAFGTSTKTDTGPVLGVDGIRRLAGLSSLPAVAIGGIGLDNAASLADTGVDGICVISSILASGDPAAATRGLKRRFELGK